MLCMDTMDMPGHMPMDIMDMDMDTHTEGLDTMARDLLMLSQRPRLKLILLSSMVLMDMVLTHMPMVLDMPTTDMDTDMPTHMPMDTTMARDLLMLSQRLRLMLMLSTDTTDMPTTHMPMDTTDMPTTDTMDMP